MAGKAGSPVQRFIRFFGSVRTGVILLIIVGVVSAAGTIILQRPMTEPDQMARAYSPQVLRVLDAFQLTNVYHAYWFVALLTLVSISIICASVERWPDKWRFYARPYRRPEPHFRALTKFKQEFPILDAQTGLDAAERGLKKLGLKPQHISENNEVSLFAERARFSVFAVYIVHISLLLIFIGGILDGLYGYKGYVSLVPGQQTNEVPLRDKTVHKLPFELRCDGAGQENYPDGSPKKWWSKLAVIENGKELFRKEIVVNDPLVHRGIRFYQSGFGASESLERLVLQATPQVASNDMAEVKPIANATSSMVTINGSKPAQIDADTTVRLVDFIPDFYIQDNQIFRRSNELNNPAIQLAVASKGTEHKVWLFPAAHQAHNQSPYHLDVADISMANFTGLSVSYEPGQWAVWAGCVLMGVGLIVAFYTFHTRYWAQIVNDGKGGLVLWVGASASKNREVFEQKFRDLTVAIEEELNKSHKEQAVAAATARS